MVSVTANRFSYLFFQVEEFMAWDSNPDTLGLADNAFTKPLELAFHETDRLPNCTQVIYLINATLLRINSL